ncbi:hypothetical protein [Streptomyces sp. NPDC001508]|uniref:hypothetical protein n=1 Tax=Streptomyces sp. NPDC001508 TaxID=3154656 RepID=UPI0033172E48
MAEQKSPSRPVAPLRAAASAVRKVPGAEALTRAGEGILDKVESVSPRGRRLAVYTGAGVLGAVGAVEWPVALTGAAVVWLTQARSKEAEAEAAGAVAGPAAPTTAAAAPQRASTGRRTSTPAPKKSTAAQKPTPAQKSTVAQKKTASAAPRGTTSKSGTSTRTTRSGTSARTTTAKRGRTTR